MSILEELWRGNLTPSERAIKPGSEYQNLTRIASAEEKCLLEYLSGDGKSVYADLCKIRSELAALSETDTFIKGFRLGAKIMLEALGEYDTPLPQVGEAG